MDLSDINKLSSNCEVKLNRCTSPCRTINSERGIDCINCFSNNITPGQTVCSSSMESNTTRQASHLVRPKTLPVISNIHSDHPYASDVNVVKPTVEDACKSSDCGHNTSDQAGVRGKDGQETMKRNIFVKLSDFFIQPNQAVIVVDLLKDHLARGLLSSFTMIHDLLEFTSKLTTSTSHHGHLFIHSAFVALSSFPSTASQLTKVVELMCQPLFVDVYTNIFEPSAYIKTSRKALLQIFLHHGCLGRVMHNGTSKFMDMTLSMGQTPLISALRHRNVDITYLLLKYGASTQTHWLAYREAIEALLFSPNVVLLSAHDLAGLRQCLPLVVSATPYIKWRHIGQLLKDGYYPLDPSWVTELKTSAQFNSPPSLKHISRAIIRDLLNWNLPSGIYRLQIPIILKSYLDIPEPSLNNAD